MPSSVKLTQGLVLEVFSIKGGAPQLVTVKLSRIVAQNLAASLTAFATGRTTKSAERSGFDLYAVGDASPTAQHSPRPVVFLNPRRK